MRNTILCLLVISFGFRAEAQLPIIQSIADELCDSITAHQKPNTNLMAREADPYFFQVMDKRNADIPLAEKEFEAFFKQFDMATFDVFVRNQFYVHCPLMRNYYPLAGSKHLHTDYSFHYYLAQDLMNTLLDNKGFSQLNEQFEGVKRPDSLLLDSLSRHFTALKGQVYVNVVAIDTKNASQMQIILAKPYQNHAAFIVNVFFEAKESYKISHITISDEATNLANYTKSAAEWAKLFPATPGKPAGVPPRPKGYYISRQ
jgi:hypothetical protein